MCEVFPLSEAWNQLKCLWTDAAIVLLFCFALLLKERVKKNGGGKERGKRQRNKIKRNVREETVGRERRVTTWLIYNVSMYRNGSQSHQCIQLILIKTNSSETKKRERKRKGGRGKKGREGRKEGEIERKIIPFVRSAQTKPRYPACDRI